MRRQMAERNNTYDAPAGRAALLRRTAAALAVSGLILLGIPARAQIEVPLMLMLVRFCLRTQGWFAHE